jgi:hypothetical protein
MSKPALTEGPLPLGGPLEGRMLVEVTAIEGMPRDKRKQHDP